METIAIYITLIVSFITLVHVAIMFYGNKSSTTKVNREDNQIVNTVDTDETIDESQIESSDVSADDNDSIEGFQTRDDEIPKPLEKITLYSSCN